MKTCSQCKKSKLPNEFWAGRYSCRDCDRGKDRAYRQSAHGKRKVAEYRSTPASMAREREYQRRTRRLHPAKNLIRHAKVRAIKKMVPFDLDRHIDELERRIKCGRCEITGIPFVFETRHWASPSIDRIIPGHGYVIGNVRIILHALNCALGTWGDSVLKQIVRRLP